VTHLICAPNPCPTRLWRSRIPELSSRLGNGSKPVVIYCTTENESLRHRQGSRLCPPQMMTTFRQLYRPYDARNSQPRRKAVGEGQKHDEPASAPSLESSVRICGEPTTLSIRSISTQRANETVAAAHVLQSGVAQCDHKPSQASKKCRRKPHFRRLPWRMRLSDWRHPAGARTRRAPHCTSLAPRQACHPCVGGAAASWLSTHNPWWHKR
jgi:hypothetical protein